VHNKRINSILNLTTENDDMSSKNAVSRNTVIRLYIVLTIILTSYFVIIFRLVDVSIMHDPESNSLNTFLHDVKHRGTIYDRNGLILATNLPTKSVYAKPDQISDIYGVSKAIAEIMQKFSDKPTKSLAERIASKLESARGFVWIKRHLLPEEYSKIKALGIPGIYFADDNKRFYQYENDFAHVIGFVDIDQNGIAGIERKFDEGLSEGKDLYLSLDSRVQEIVHTHLHNTVIEQEALGGMAILMDANNGEIISLVSLPDFNPNASMNGLSSEAMFNRATLGVYEMGSTFKILTLAMGLDSSAVKLSDTFNVANPLKLGKYKINDYKFHKPILNLSELLILSSNRGVAQVAYKIGIAKQQQYMRNVGILSPVDLEITESAKPIHVSQKQWNEIYLATISYGYGVAVTTMHTVQAIAAVTNGGILYKPTLIKQKSKPDGVRVFKESTSKSMRKIMRLVVEEGYAKKANVDGYDVGGKTGTAEKIKNGKYIKKNCNFTFFVGAFPISNPKYVIIVGVDEPKPNKINRGFATGGAVAAPLAGLIIRDVGQLLGVSQ
jgi:cell division protein FtsI (penicillin-binding protein 3)